jgi:hypothetical protein
MSVINLHISIFAAYCISYSGIREESAAIIKSAVHCPIKMLGEALTLGALIPKK